MMKSKTLSRQGHWGKTLAAVAFALVLGTSALSLARPGPAPFRYDPHHDRDWNAHARAAYDYRWHHPGAPGYVYAPPVVYAAPPPPSGLNLIIPLNIR